MPFRNSFRIFVAMHGCFACQERTLVVALESLLGVAIHH